MVAPSGDASGVVRVGLVDTFTPSFYIDVYTPLIESLKARLPQYRFETKEISHADAMKPESVENIDFVIVSSGGARMLSRAGLQQIATLRKSRCADVSRSVGAVFLVPAGSPVQTIEDLRGRRVAAHLIRATAAGEKDVAGILQGKDGARVTLLLDDGSETVIEEKEASYFKLCDDEDLF